MFDIPTNPPEEEDDDNMNPGDIPTNNQNLGASKAFKTPSTSTTADFSLDELKTLKKNKPAEYLKVIMITKGNSTNKCSSSSTISGGQSTNEPTDKLIKKSRRNHSMLTCSKY